MTTTSDPPLSELSDPKPTGEDSRSLSASVRRGALWIVASNVLLRVANVLLTAVIAHILSPHDFGVFAVALTAYTIVSSIGELGVSACLMRADLDIDSLAPTATTVSVFSCTILAVAMSAFAGPIAAALGSAAAVGPVRVMSFAVLLMGVFAVPNNQMMRDFKQDKVFLANVIGFVPSTVLLIVLAESGGGAMAFAWSMVVRQFIIGCVLIAAAPRYYWPGFARSALLTMFRLGIPLAGANFVNYILLNVDYAFVGHLLGATALGVYMLAFTVASWPYGLLGSVINNLSTPAFSRVKHDPDLLRNALATSLRGVSLIVLPMCGMTIALAHPIVQTMYGSKWAAAANVLVVLSFYGAVSMVCLLFANILNSFGRTGLLFILQLIWIGTLVPAMTLGVHRDGIVGAAYAHVAVIVPIVLPSYALALKRTTNVRLIALGKAALPALLASSAAAIAARGAASQFGSPLAQLVVGLMAGGTIYTICVGKQVLAVLGRGQDVERVLKFYGIAARLFNGIAARLVGLSTDGRARHSARYLRGQAMQALNNNVVLGNITIEYERQSDAGYPEIPATRADLTRAYYRGTNSVLAVAVHERSLADLERQLGPDHPHTLASRTNLAYAYRHVGLLEKAIELYERTLADWRRLLGPDHPRTMRASNYLAAAYHDAGRLAEAISLYERTLADRRRLLGADHPAALRSSSYLAGAYHDAGRLAEAISLYERTLADRRRLLGADHPATLRSGNYLASAYRDAGRLAEAMSLHEQIMARSIQVLSSDHPDAPRHEEHMRCQRAAATAESIRQKVQP
jgi:PST family polysaccharide transporter